MPCNIEISLKPPHFQQPANQGGREWVGSSDGLGYLILTFNNQTATAEVFAAIAVLAVLGIGLFALVGMLERLVLPWYYAARVDRQESDPPG